MTVTLPWWAAVILALFALVGASAIAGAILHKTPAPACTRVPGPAPVPGQSPPEEPRTPERPAPAPGHTHTPQMRLLTARFFTDGCVDIWNATGARTHRFEAGPPDLSDEAIERFIRDARD